MQPSLALSDVALFLACAAGFFTPKALYKADRGGSLMVYNAFGVKAFRGLDTQGARLRRDPGLWSTTASR